MYLAVFLYLGYFSEGTLGAAYSDNIEEDSVLNVPELLEKYGYPVEIYHVITSDGYNLTMHRIPFGRDANNQPSTNKQVVFLMHGLLASSNSWTLNGPGSAFAYVLAEANYDVWLGNARGNKYSRSHISLSPNDPEFWHFSWHEIGIYDLPAMMDFVIDHTGKSRIHYIGHSQGTTTFFVLNSLLPNYSSKFITAHALAPVAFMNNMFSPIFRAIAPLVDELDLVTQLLGVNEFLPNSEFIANVVGAACLLQSPAPIVCSNAVFLLSGYDVQQLNTTMLPVYVRGILQGASTRQLVHYGQEINSARFRQYDYLLGNMEKYNAGEPPDYPIERICLPLYLHYGDNDWLAAVVDVERFYNIIRQNRNCCNRVQLMRVPLDKFNHVDFVLANNIKELLYDKIMEIMAAAE